MKYCPDQLILTSQSPHYGIYKNVQLLKKQWRRNVAVSMVTTAVEETVKHKTET